MTIRRDYPREQERAARRGNRGWIAAAVVAAGVVGGIAAYSMTGERKSTGLQTNGMPTGQNSVPSTVRIAPVTQNQPSPQGSTGPLTTKSGGAPASSPQGETPGGMQALPEGSSEKTIGQSK